jgi:hypothetical protein
MRSIGARTIQFRDIFMYPPGQCQLDRVGQAFLPAAGGFSSRLYINSIHPRGFASKRGLTPLSVGVNIFSESTIQGV